VFSRKDLSLTVEGAHFLPKRGPVLIAARHYHHLYDGCALVRSTNRPLHILVALDWVSSGARRGLMERACRMAGWPVVLRGDGLAGQQSSAFRSDEARRYLRAATRASVDLLRAGEALVVFPEAYPNIDPSFTPKVGDDFLPFRPGFVRLAELAQRDGSTRVPIVPAGFSYAKHGKSWRVTLRYGEPITLDDSTSRAEVVARVEQRVRELSAGNGQFPQGDGVDARAAAGSTLMTANRAR
jgi:putative membrane protein